MIKICDKSVSYLLKSIFVALFQEGFFARSWKKANIVFVHKKQEKSAQKL